ncbi:MAG: VirK/YbjX family protein [Amphiplicatus sp.]
MTKTARIIEAAARAAPGWRPRALRNRALMLATAWRHRAAVSAMLDAPASSDLGRLLRERPEMLGALIWPYQTASWPASERLRRIADHCAVVDTLGPPFLFSVEEKLVLLDLGEVYPDLRVVLDQPKWFMREGQFTLNLFIGSFRAYSLAFSFHRGADGTREAFIGGLQGRNRKDALDLYRDLTKALHGQRPRDFILELLRMLCRATGAERICAVSNAHRHQLHPFLNKKDAFALDYDEIWRERGGRAVNAVFFELDRDPPARDLAEVKPNKRSMYRRRAQFLAEVEAGMRRRLPSLAPVRFKDD